MSNTGILEKPIQQAGSTAGGGKPPLWASVTRTTLWTSIALVSAVLLTEAVFAVAHIGEEEFVDIQPTVGFWRMPQKLVTWRSEGYAQDVTNKDGMRDSSLALEKPPGVVRIAAVGDSMVEGYQVSSDQTFVKQLANRLTADGIKSEGLNFGMSGFSTTQALYLFKEKIQKYHPDVLILAYHIGDNEKNNYVPSSGAFMPRPYVSLKDGILQTDWRGYDLWWQGPMHANYDSNRWLRANSRIWGAWSKTDLQLSEIKWYSNFKKLFEPKYKSTSSVPERFTSTASDFGLPDQKLDVSFTAMPEAHWLNMPMPENLPKKEAAELAKQRDIVAGWHAIMLGTNQRFATTSAILDVLNRACRQANCKLVVAGLPAPSNSMLFKRELMMIDKLAKQSGFTFVNVNAEFPQLAAMQKSDYYYNVHFTPRGHALVTDIIAKRLKADGLLMQLRTSP